MFPLIRQFSEIRIQTGQPSNKVINNKRNAKKKLLQSFSTHRHFYRLRKSLEKEKKRMTISEKQKNRRKKAGPTLSSHHKIERQITKKRKKLVLLFGL